MCLPDEQTLEDVISVATRLITDSIGAPILLALDQQDDEAAAGQHNHSQEADGGPDATLHG